VIPRLDAQPQHHDPKAQVGFLPQHEFLRTKTETKMEAISGPEIFSADTVDSCDGSLCVSWYPC